MRKRFLSVVFALSIVGGIALPAMAESRLFPAMGISQTDADGLYGSLAGEAGWGGTQDYSLATLIAKAATADGHVVNRLFGDGRYAQLAASNTFTSGAFTFTNPFTVNFDAATTFDGAGFIMTMTATSWDFRGSSFAPFIINATTGPEAVNRDTGDTRWAQLAAANVFAALNTFNGNLIFGDAVGDTVTYNAGTHTYTNPLLINYDGFATFDATGNVITFLGLRWDYTGTAIRVADPASVLEAVNLQTGDARYVAQTSLKAGTVPGASFAGNPKTFTVTFGTAFPDTNYAVTVDGEDARTFTFQTKLAGSFVINTNANLAIAGDVDWTATAHNDP